jgi:hypothetical protein
MPRALLPACLAVVCAYLGTAELVPRVIDGGVGALSGISARVGVGALGGVAAQGGVGARGSVAARRGVGAFGGVGIRGGVCILYQCTSGVPSSSSSSSSSSIKPAMTLRHFRLLSSSSIFKRPFVPRGLVVVFF